MKVIVDPADLRRFAAVLEQETHTLRERQRAVEAARRELSEVWRDTRYRSFERTYLPAIQVLERFQKASERYAAYLRTKADRADTYLGKR
ncbi:MAG TPA: hypothetical protein VLH75_05970 [Longimicrobiales bacterium]|nr:hypothetical protein [Longimicrobiales bacterium]